MKYDKPHLPYDKQFERLVDRGLGFADEAAARSALKSIGYYRFSAYTYPFRISRHDGDPATSRRGDQFVEGATFEDAIDLCRFDDRLRLVLLDALQQIEIGMRVQIGYVLGKSDPFGHLDISYLDAASCNTRTSPDGARTVFDEFLETYDRATSDARGEEFVKHFHLKYDGEMPVWVATECMTFGMLVRLFSLMKPSDTKKIAGALGIRNAEVVHRYLKALNVLRNHCAHNNRVWNRATVYPPARPNEKLTNPRLHHLRQCDPDRIYFLAALAAHFAIALNPQTNWPRQFKTLARKFPGPREMTLENQMGFPAGWDRLELWNYEPAGA